MSRQFHVSTLRLVAYLVLWNGRPSNARPRPQEEEPESLSGSSSITLVETTATVDGSTIAATFTPTSFCVSELDDSVTTPTTITTTNSAGETVAIAIAAGAGIVAGGALAAWLFEPKPGNPPPPTSPPSYRTVTRLTTTTQDETTSTSSTSTSSAAPACLLPTGIAEPDFALASEQPQWTAEIPSQTINSVYPECTPSNDNSQLFHGLSPEFIGELADLFCAEDLSQDIEKTLGKDDLPDDSTWKRDDGPEFPVKFTFDLKSQFDSCAENCRKAYSRTINGCQHDSNYLFGGGSIAQGCGTYGLEVEGDPITKLTCTGSGDDPLRNYLYRDAAQDARSNFYGARHGSSITQNDEGSFIQESAFSIWYADSCAGSGSYTFEKDLCIDYLTQTLDACDTDDISHKHGGTLLDTDNCGEFNFHPQGFDLVACYPENEEKGYIISGQHVAISEEIATDAINAFCDRSGDGQKYTLDPQVQPEEGFTQETCTTDGLAACAYFYRDDGTRVTEDGDIGDVVIKIEAEHFNPADALTCNPAQVYEIHGERCKQMLGMFTGTQAIKQCIADDPSKLDLGTLVENGDKGCVTWNMWAVATHG